MRRFVIALGWLLILAAMPVGASDDSTKGTPEFGGPDNVEATIQDDAEDKRPIFETGFLDGYHAWKAELAERTGFSYGIDYSAAFYEATESPGEDDAASGMLRFYGAWEATGRDSGNSGALVWKVEHRHAFGSLPPSGFGFELGNVGLFVPPFNDNGTRLTNLYWRQRFKGGRVAMVAGFLDATDYVDVYAMASPWTGFNNFAFSTGTTTINLPGDALLGAAAGGMITDKLYMIGGFGDMNSDPTDPFEGFETFFEDREFFKHVEIGWTSSHDRIYYDNMHVTIWHSDEREAAMVPADWGVNVSYSRMIHERWMPFARAGWADDAVSLMEKSVSVGFGYNPAYGTDQLGVGINWGDPSESFGQDLDDQLAFEGYYRLQLSDETAITPSVQLLMDPALNPTEDSIWVFGLRLRVAL